MDTEWVKVLHVAANDDVVCSVSDNFVLDFLPAFERLLNEDLGTQTEGLGGQVTEFVLVVGETRAKTTKREGGTEDDWVANLLSGFESSWDGSNSSGLSCRDVYF